ncbi:MAG: beta-phosphoglucomutase [Syntrophus sp. (in: bacteria)]|nr:beta-phosphoglucomutase [Syntrophus sp. (in: bacteria)]
MIEVFMTSTKTGQIECVIYDCDGVMFDSLNANERLYNKIATSTGRHPLTPEELQYCHTHTVNESISHLFRFHKDLEIKAIDYWKNSINFQEFIVYLIMEPHLVETLAILKERGIKRAVSTNRTSSMPHIMEKFGLWPYFDMVVTALDVKNPKPHPESVEKILDALKVDREKTLFLGDSAIDRETALAGGVQFISYKNDSIAVDGLIHDHLDLLNFLSNGPYLRS